ncbi:YchJ family protein [Herminiimonas aquatilis]|uniref:YchJ family protein n=1 Tax=Herminiimonas aquatilis TaxID=345342 RepID=A0ABW2J377_9BURK
MAKAHPAASAACPCGNHSGKDSYATCCKVFHDGADAPDAEALMRSRYSAYVLGLMHYVHATWHATTRPPLTDFAHDAATKWLGLDVKKFVAGETEATVEFVARSKSGGRAQRLHEVSRFVKEDGRWFYIDGVFPE